MLPSLSGGKLIVEIRKSCAVPIIVLSDKVELLNSSPDNYLTKPY